MPEDQQEQGDANRVIELTMSGDSLSPEEAAALEKTLDKNPLDLDSRILLLGYYWRRKYKSPEVREVRIKHIAWFVDNRPEHRVAGLSQMDVHQGIDSLRHYIDIRARWNAQIASHQSDIDVLYNAAQFFFLQEKEIAEQCFLRAKELDTHNPKWFERLAHLYKLWGTSYEMQALDECERCLDMTTNPDEEFDVLRKLPELAFAANDIDKAVNYANRVLTLSETHKEHFVFGFAVQAAHTTLGRVALKNGDVDKANYHLLQSLPRAADAQQMYIGQPERQLVAEIFDAGERESVLKWLDLCSSFVKVEEWREKIEKGESPWTYMRQEKHKYFNLSRLPRSAFNKGQWEQAKHAAEEFFELAKMYRDDERHYGFGMHTAHVVLGQLALRVGDRESAKLHLKEAGSVAQAERLAEQGPDMRLAMDLLLLGEKDLVLKFLKDCKRLWGDSADSALLKDWTKDVKACRVPADWVLLYSGRITLPGESRE